MSNSNDWIPERVKTWIVIITMTFLVGGVGWAFIAAHIWSTEREAERLINQQELSQEQQKEQDNIK